LHSRLDKKYMVMKLYLLKEKDPDEGLQAERVGFEPTIPCGIRALQARALGRTTQPLQNQLFGWRRNYNTSDFNNILLNLS